MYNFGIDKIGKLLKLTIKYMDIFEGMGYNYDNRNYAKNNKTRKRGTFMKGKKLWAIILTVCLIVSSIGVMSVVAEGETDVQMSVAIDKASLKAGDVVTVSVNLDSFQSTVNNDERKTINTMQFEVPYDGTIFEYVDGSMENGLITAVDEEYGDFIGASNANNKITAAVVYNTAKEGAISETTTKAAFLTFQLKVKDTVSNMTDVSFGLQNVIMKNMRLDDAYSVSTTGTAAKIYTAPTVTLEGTAGTAADTYTTAVKISATAGSKITVNGTEQTENPYTVSTAGTYEVTATNEVGLTSESKIFTIDPIVAGISLKSAPTKTDYVIGNTLSVDGGVLTVTLSNGETEEVDITAEMCSGFDSTTDGEKTVTVTYEGQTATFKVNVNAKQATAIAWKTQPAATIIEGQKLSVALANAKLTVNFDDGSVEDVAVTEDMCKDFDQTTIGAQTVTVTYGSFTETFNITVNAKKATGIKVTAPTDTEYIEGTDLDLAGSKIEVSYDNGDKEDVDVTSEMVSGFNSLTPVESQIVTVSYEGFTDTFTVKIVAKSVASIAVTTLPKILYIEGNTLDVTGGKVTITYDNATTKIVDLTADMVNGFDSATPAESIELTVSYTENGVTKTTTYNVEIVAKSVTAVELVSGPTNASIIEGQTLDLAGAKVRVSYDNGTSEEKNVTADMLVGFDNTKVGTQTVAVKDGNITSTGTFTVTVAEKSVASIAVTTMPKTEYIEGNTFVVDGGKVTVTYDNGFSEEKNLSEVDVVAADTTTPGSNKIVTVSYTEKGKTVSTTYTINVAEKSLVSIAVTKTPSKISVIEGQDIDVTDGEITLTYDNETTTVVTMTADMVTGYDRNLVGTQILTVSYNGKTTTLTVEVAAKQVSEVELISKPTATSVTEGMEYDVTGGQIKVTYDNGTTELLPITLGMIPSFDNSKVGTQTVDITYANKTVGTLTIEVLEKVLTGITTNKTSYDVTVGDGISALGLEVTAQYNNNTTADVTQFVEVTEWDTEKLGRQEVTISFTEKGVEKTVEIEIFVLEKSDFTGGEVELDGAYIVVNEPLEEMVKKVEASITSLKEIIEKYAVLDIKLLSKNEGIAIQPDGTITVTILIPATLDKSKNLVVYRMEEDGTLTELKSQVVGDKIKFDTDHFSTYVIAEKKVEEPTTQEPATEATTTAAAAETTTSPSSVKTGDARNVMAILAVIALAGAGFVVVSRKKEQM